MLEAGEPGEGQKEWLCGAALHHSETCFHLKVTHDHL